jgi:hypothetical protein
MKKPNAFLCSLIAGWFITASVILLIAFLVIPKESQSPYFLHRLVWTEVLCLVFWSGALFYFLVPLRESDARSRFGGIAPMLSIITATYAAMSFLAMVTHAYVPVSDTAYRWHLAIQIVLFLIAALSIVFLSISRAGAAESLPLDHSEVVLPRELHDLIAACELTISNTAAPNPVKNAIKQLRETVRYSLGESSRLSEIPAYKNLCEEVKEFCLSIENLNRSDNNETVNLQNLDKKALLFANRFRSISTNMTRR